MCYSVYDTVTDFEVFRFIKNKKVNYLKNETFFSKSKKIHSNKKK